MTNNGFLLRYLRLGLLALACVGALPCHAATLTVTNTNDSGPGSLRQTIADAQTGDRIVFSVTGTIALNSNLEISGKNLTIAGPGAAKLTLQSQLQDFILFDSGVTTSVSGLTILNGAIGNDGVLTIQSVIIPRFTTINNTATLTIIDSTLANSFTTAITNQGGTVTLVNSTFTNNSPVPSSVGLFGGGAIYSDGVLTIANSTFTGNSSPNNGGAIFVRGSAKIVNSTFVGNTAYEGGAIYEENGTVSVVNSTIVGNSYGGISAPGGTMTLKNTLLAQNDQSGLGNCDNYYGLSTFTSAGYNLSDDSSCGAFFTQPTDKNNVPAQLDPKGLQNNGGPTQTIALLPTSPAVDAIPVAACTDTNNNPVTTDQRGITRPQGKGCDIGAYELVQAVPFASFHPALIIGTGKKPGFVLTSTFTLGSATAGLHPAAEAFTLKIANYTLTLPAGSFHQLWSGSNAPYGYEGTVNGATVVLGLIPLGNNTYSFNAAGSPVTFPGITNPVAVALTFGNDTGTSSVKALLTNY